MAKIVIIGGGITGTSAAWQLAKSGHQVTLAEKLRLAAMASGWTLAGVRQSGRDARELPLAVASIRLWQDLAERLGAETGYRRTGNLRLARNADEAAVIRALVGAQRALGLDLAYIEGGPNIRAIAPAVSGSAVVAASFCPSDGQADPDLTVAAFAAAAERSGAEIRIGLQVNGIAARNGKIAGVETSEGFIPADCVVVCAGIHTPALLAPLGLRLPLTIQHVTAVQTAPAAHCLDQVFGVANADCAGRQEASGAFRFTSGGTRWDEPADSWTEAGIKPSQQAVNDVVRLVGQVVPQVFQTPVARSWGGLVDLTPDNLPVIDAPAGVSGLVVAAGYSGHGFALGPISGELIAALASGERPALDLSHFCLARFADKRTPDARPALHG